MKRSSTPSTSLDLLPSLTETPSESDTTPAPSGMKPRQTLPRSSANVPQATIELHGQRYLTLLDRFQKGTLRQTEIQELFSEVARLRVALAIAHDTIRKNNGKV